MRKLSFKMIDKKTGNENVSTIEVPDSKLSIVVLKSDDPSFEVLEEVQRQAQASLPDRKVIAMAVYSDDDFEFYQEE